MLLFFQDGDTEGDVEMVGEKKKEETEKKEEEVKEKEGEAKEE
jgi:hypothetical protein